MGLRRQGSRAGMKAVFFCVATCCYALLGLLSQLSKEADGTFAYSLPSVVLLAELCHLFCLFSASKVVEESTDLSKPILGSKPPNLGAGTAENVPNLPED